MPPEYWKKRDAVARCLIEYLGERQEDHFQDSQDEHDNVMDQTMKVLVIHDARDRGPADVSIVIEGDGSFEFVR
ncbi:hypothetical protein NQZ68_035342 [Dissostichus eleginoides]|nr:hypothetical protein NQZ68_035342 [Dissostichus eleginoides]